MKTEISPSGVEVRYDGEGSPEDIVARQVSLVHLEKMGKGRWWVKVGDVVVDLVSVRGDIHAKTRVEA